MIAASLIQKRSALPQEIEAGWRLEFLSGTSDVLE